MGWVKMFFALLALAMASFAVIGRAAEVSDTEIEMTDTLYTQEVMAKAWGLSVEDWQQYRSLMEGPRAIWSPNLDPITVLGIHAETEAERRRYAELLVMIEYERVESELLFQRAYDQAAQRLFPSLLPVTTTAMDEAITLLPGVERIAFFGSVDPSRCPDCQDQLATLLLAHLDPRAPVLDLFLADASDDEAIRVWARAHGIGSAEVRAGRITLNHAPDSALISEASGLITPRVMQQSAGQWRTTTLDR